MNIQQIYNAKINTMPLVSRADNPNSHFGIRMAQPLNADSVSFTGKAGKVVSKEIQAAIARKQARALRDAKQEAEAKLFAENKAQTKKKLEGEERKRGISISTSKVVREMILEPQDKIDAFMKKAFGDLRVTQLSPKNLILKMSGRAKSVISIMEKSATRNWNSKKEVLEKMTDLNGYKIILNYKTGKQDAETVLDRLIPLIQMKQVNLQEIELQRPKAIEENLDETVREKYDYVSKIFLDKLEDAQEEVINGLETNTDNIKLIDRPVPKYTGGNYCALHLILQPTEKGSRPFELQIMGPRVSDGKAFDDKRYKFFDGKIVDKMYAPLVSLWKRLLPDENAAAKARFLRYCKEANFQLREDELKESNTQKQLKKTDFYRDVSNYILPPEYDLNYQYKLMRKLEEEAKAQAEAKAKEEANAKEEAKKSTNKVIEPIKKIETKILEVEHRVTDLTKEKLQKLAAMYSSKTSNTGKGKKKVK